MLGKKTIVTRGQYANVGSCVVTVVFVISIAILFIAGRQAAAPTEKVQMVERLSTTH
jgi:hypothetical protein